MVASVMRLARNLVILLLAGWFAANLLAVLGGKFVDARIAGKFLAKAELPNYRQAPWAARHFRELVRVRSSFHAYYGWRHEATAGETINIDGQGRRLSSRRAEAGDDRTVAFFGGSTMFGDGVRDEETIPSFVAKLSRGLKTVNYGTRGYVSHQSVNRFLNDYYAGARPDVVVMYDGFNDVAMLCRTGVPAFSHAQALEMRAKLESDRFNPAKLASLLLPVLEFVPRIQTLAGYKLELGSAEDQYRCRRDPARAEAIARNLVSDWRFMQRLVAGYGGRFVAVLQPVAALSRTRLDHLALNPQLLAEFEPVYGRIAELLRRPEFAPLRGSVHDLTHVLDRDAYLYIDEAHVSPNGNRYIAEKLVAILRQPGG